MQAKVNCSGYFRAYRRHQVAIFLGNGDFGTSPFLGSSSVRTISLTVRQRTTVPAYKIRPVSQIVLANSLFLTSAAMTIGTTSQLFAFRHTPRTSGAYLTSAID
jgi:hypothetical protein